MQQQAQQLLCERQQLLSGALHGQRAGAALENMQTLASHQRACVATPCERQAIARDSLRKANNAQVQGAPCHPAESTPGTPTKAPSSEEDPQGCSPISSLADDPSYPLAHRTLQRDAPSSPVTKEGGAPSDQTVSSPGWTAVRASVKKANEPESPTAEGDSSTHLPSGHCCKPTCSPVFSRRPGSRCQVFGREQITFAPARSRLSKGSCLLLARLTIYIYIYKFSTSKYCLCGKLTLCYLPDAAEKRRRLRAAKLAEDPLPRTNPLSAYGEYEMPTDEQWTK